MNEYSSALLLVYLRSDCDETPLHYIEEILTIAGITYRLIAQQEERIPFEGFAPFVITLAAKRIAFALHTPLDAKVIEDMARLMTTGLILGFTVRGEIALGGEVGVINNLRG